MRYQALAIVLLSARGVYCTGSEHPIYTGASEVADSTIVGRWQGAADSVVADSIVITRAFPDVPSNKEYLVTTYGEGTVQHDELHLTRIGGLLFADLTPSKADERWNAISIHGILLGRKDRERLVLHWIDAPWVQKYALTHPKEITVDSLGMWAVLTDSTSKVRAFLVNHTNPSTWSKDSVVLIRAPVPGTR